MREFYYSVYLILSNIYICLIDIQWPRTTQFCFIDTKYVILIIHTYKTSDNHLEVMRTGHLYHAGVYVN